MSEQKHTPGPWMSTDRTVYALMHDGWKRGVEQFKNRFYASVQYDRECSEQEAVANARLIAAAPELLEALAKTRAVLHACQAVIHLAGGFDIAYVSGAQAAMKQADAAIAKATGAA